MFAVMVTLLAALVVLIIVQLLWAHKIITGEYARKTVHIFIYSFLALWPLYLSWQEIRIVIGIGMVFAIAMRILKWFPSMFDINRKTWGDLLGAISAFALTYLEPSMLLFAVIGLHIGLADGLAAIIGTKYGKRTNYKVLGHTKSLIGSGAFFVTSLLIMLTVLISGNLQITLPIFALLAVPIITTFTENIGIFGTDNALIPLALVVLFEAFHLT